MPHETSLIATFTLGLTAAWAGGSLARRLGMQPLVGYLMAGIAVGPFTPGFVAHAQLSAQLAEIGVILLMFGVGMHFSIRDLWAVRGVAIPGAIAQIVAATAMGAAVSRVLGWPWSAGVLLGLTLSVASTIVLLKALERRGILSTEDGRIAVGWLIVEDLVMVLTLVLLPAVTAPSGDAHAISRSLLWTIGKLVAFVLLMLTGGRIFPWLLTRVSRNGSGELFTVAVVAMSLGVAVGAATLFGVSYALGAFFAGILVHESDVGDRAAGEMRPLQDVFTALFFVGVGMLFDPAVLVRQPWQVVAVTGIVMIGKSLAAFGIVLLLGRPVRTAALVAAALGQIGEFSFILAAMGISLGAFPTEGRNLVVAGALISITLNPLLFRAVSRWTD